MVALAGLGGGFIMACISLGVYVGKLQSRVDTAQRDLNQCFKMIRELQKENL